MQKPYATMSRNLSIYKPLAWSRNQAKQDRFKLRLKEMPYIGYVLTPSGLKPNPMKVQVITDFETPKDVKGVQRILGLVNYLSKFMSHFSVMCQPIRLLVQPDVVCQ